MKHFISQYIRRLSWEGGKSNEKGFHLVNWVVVHAPKAHGGLRVKDLELMNITLGDKLL